MKAGVLHCRCSKCFSLPAKRRLRKRAPTLSLLSLPEEVLLCVLKCLSAQDLPAVRAVHSRLRDIIDSNTSVWANVRFQDVWPKPDNLWLFERAAESRNFEAAVKLGIAYLYNEGPSVSDEGRAEVCGLKASRFFSLAESLRAPADPFVWLFIRPPWSPSGSCCKAVVFESLRAECQADPDEQKHSEALTMLEESSSHGCLQSSYLLWESKRRAAMGDPGRYLQCLRTLRDYAAKGSWEAQLALAKACVNGNQLGLEAKACSDVVSQIFQSSCLLPKQGMFTLQKGMNDTMRYLQCLRTLRDYAAKGSWEAQLALAKACVNGNQLGLEAKACSDVVSQIFQSSCLLPKQGMFTLQKGMNDTMRYILVDWLVEVTTMKDFSSLSLHVTVGCVDRYLLLRSVPKARLQLLGIACMVICTRYILVDWLVEVTTMKDFSSLSLHVTVGCVDRYLLLRSVPKARLQLLGIACMVICTRYTSKEILTIREAVWLTDNTYKYEDLVRMMGEVISALEGKIRVCTTSSSPCLCIIVSRMPVKLNKYTSKEILTIREAVWLTDNTYKYEDLVRMMGEVISALEGKIRVCTTSSSPWVLNFTIHFSCQELLACHCSLGASYFLLVGECTPITVLERVGQMGLTTIGDEVLFVNRSMFLYWRVLCDPCFSCLVHSANPWSSHLSECTGYSLQDLVDCVLSLHKKCCQELLACHCSLGASYFLLVANPWSSHLSECTGYSLQDLVDCVLSLHKKCFHDDVPKDYRHVSLTGVTQRFEDDCYQQISKEKVLEFSELCVILEVKEEELSAAQPLVPPSSSTADMHTFLSSPASKNKRRREDGLREDRGSFVATPTTELSNQEETLLGDFLDWSLDTSCSGYEGDQESEGEKEGEVTVPCAMLDLVFEDGEQHCRAQSSEDESPFEETGHGEGGSSSRTRGVLFRSLSDPPADLSSGYSSVNSSPPSSSASALGKPLAVSALALPPAAQRHVHRRQLKRKNAAEHSGGEISSLSI
ncbi:UNVERIFIED_CONTAM: hypothetical protein FKN15_033209 [Acipenser sinensis]